MRNSRRIKRMKRGQFRFPVGQRPLEWRIKGQNQNPRKNLDQFDGGLPGRIAGNLDLGFPLTNDGDSHSIFGVMMRQANHSISEGQRTAMQIHLGEVGILG